MRNVAQSVVLQMLRAYKWAISPMFPPACRYVPTCSEYAMEAVESYGAMRGMFMAFLRLMRCHPFARGGYDPVVKAGVPASTGECDPRATWTSGALAPRPAAQPLTGFSPFNAEQHLERNA